MAHETQPVNNQKQNCDHQEGEVTEGAGRDIDEIEMPQEKSFSSYVTRMMEKFASTHFGQVMIVKTDRALKVVEATAKWSLPQDDNTHKLERPLPWILFFMLIILLRVFRVWFSVCAYMVGSQPVTPHSMVYYIQTKRRRLRALRVQGLKSIRSREMEAASQCSKDKDATVVGKLRNLLGTAICKPGQHCEVTVRRASGQDGKNLSSQEKYERSAKRWWYDDSIDHELTVDEMLEKYANEDSDNDSDYIPKEDEDDTSSASSSSGTDENPEKANQSTEITDNSKTETSTKDQSIVEVKENGGKKPRAMPKPLADIKTEMLSDADSCNEQQQTPKEAVYSNGLGDSARSNDCETPAAAAEVAPQKAQISPKSMLNHLTAPQLEENNNESIPGHESAASLKTSFNTATVGSSPSSNDKVAEKCYRTIQTTQTSIELDWSITIKTEITHKKQYPKLEKLNCSLQLTPASSTEDIFYSPIGSPQDFHSIFHPAPIVKGSTAEVQTSTPKENDLQEKGNSDNEQKEDRAGVSRKKRIKNSNHNKRNHHNNRHNSRNRNRLRH